MKAVKWLLPGMKVKRWVTLSSLGIILISLGLAIIFNEEIIGKIEKKIITLVYMLTKHFFTSFSLVAGILIILVGLVLVVTGFRKTIKSIMGALLPDSEEKLVELVYQRRQLERGAKIVVIGGGTGLSTLLRGLKRYTSNITAIVTVADDGGSSGRLRQELGILPPGDIRNCLVALADTEPLMEKLFQYRFNGGSTLSGHNFGNLFIAAMLGITEDFQQALQESSKVLAVKGRVLPSTLDQMVLCAELEDGSVVKGESQVGKSKGKIERLFLEHQECTPLPEAIQAIYEADAVILGPGSLYTSIMPNLLVPGILEALREADNLKVYVCNVMTQPGETDGFTASDHVRILVEQLGMGVLSHVLVNNKPVSLDLKEKYREDGSWPVSIDAEEIKNLDVEMIEADLINQTNVVRHNSLKLARTLMRLIVKRRNGWDRRSLIDFYLLERLMR